MDILRKYFKLIPKELYNIEEITMMEQNLNNQIIPSIKYFSNVLWGQVHRSIDGNKSNLLKGGSTPWTENYA